ncbi:MAG: FeoA domain-containing protein [Thermoplasmata archaeon]|nr:FeoA domain-containing protein [Thermoplasmata archaeon]
MIPIAFAQGLFRVLQINCGPTCKSKLSSLGILPGEVVRVVNNAGGPVIVNVKDTRIALGRGMAMKIYGEVIGR